MNLGDVKIVDLQKSEVDWESPLTDPASGRYAYHKKVYWDRLAGSLGGKYFPRFVTDDKEGNLESWMYGYDASPIKYDDPQKDFYPEPLKPDTTHGYRFKDAVLMRINVEMWMDKVEKDRSLSNRLRDDNKKAFNSEMAAHDAELLPDADVVLSDGIKTKLV